MLSGAASLRITWIVLCTMAITVCGCGESENAELAALRSQLVLSSAPDGQMSVADVRTSLTEDEATEEVDVVIKGRINAGDIPPWEPGKAAFVLTDITGHEGESDHDPHQCPFCSRNIQDYLANIKFHDEQGNVIAVDAQELFSVKEKQLVTIQGKAHLTDTDTLVIHATGIFVDAG